MAKFEEGHPKVGGRRAGTPNRRTEVIDELKGYANKTGIPHLKDLAKDPKTPRSLMVEIEKYLIDREHGRPRQAIDCPNCADIGPRGTMSPEDTAKALRRLADASKPIEPAQDSAPPMMPPGVDAWPRPL